MSQEVSGTVVLPTIITSDSGALAFMPAGLSTSSFEVTGSDLEAFIRETASYQLDALDNKFKITIPATSSGQTEDIIPLYLSSSGINPRVGIGTTNPLTTFEFKETSDTSKGSELLLVGTRTTKGADVGDSAGIINFAIETGSTDFTETGSVGKIKGVVTAQSGEGIQGKLVFELFKDNYSSLDAIEFGYGLGNNSLTTTVMTSSLELKDTSATGHSKFNMFDSSDNLKFEILKGSVTASGDISASGDIIAGNITSTINGGTF